VIPSGIAFDFFVPKILWNAEGLLSQCDIVYDKYSAAEDYFQVLYFKSKESIERTCEISF
jgi:hypothetical protein